MDYEEIYTQEELDDQITDDTSFDIVVNSCDGDISDLVMVGDDGDPILRIRPDDYNYITVERPKPLMPEPKAQEATTPCPAQQWHLHGDVYPCGLISPIQVNEIFNKYRSALDRYHELHVAFGSEGGHTLVVDVADQDGNFFIERNLSYTSS